MKQQSRRRFLQRSLAAGAALAVPARRVLLATLAAEAAQARKRCLVLWTAGGLSHIDTLDMKPDTPVEFRGAFKPIQTTVPGVHICEHLPLLAKLADKLAIVRSMTHGWADQRGATYLMHTAYPRQPHGQHPELGALLARYRGAADADLPGFIRIAPENKLTHHAEEDLAAAYPGAGFLGPSYQPLQLASYLAAPGDKLKGACDLSKEPSRMRERYGDNDFGKNCLAARRLLEAGVPFVEIQLPGFDLHTNLFGELRRLLPVLDGAWSALLQDLHDRGLLEETLVVCLGEFGRMPKINDRIGRDHWPGAWSLALAGGGIRGGRVYGATDAKGAAVKENPVTPGDLFATLYTAVGIDPAASHPSGTQEVRVTPRGAKPVDELLARAN
jgi:uncharacterized protein (DUF1501 family)